MEKSQPGLGTRQCSVLKLQVLVKYRSLRNLHWKHVAVLVEWDAVPVGPVNHGGQRNKAQYGAAFL